MPSTQPATVADWLAQPEDARLELIDGELIPKAAPTFEHGQAQVATSVVLAGPFGRKPAAPMGPAAGGSAARSTSCSMAAAIALTWRAGGATACRRCRASGRSPCAPIGCARSSASRTARPTRSRILDQSARALTVYRHHADGYVIVLAAEAGERERAEPFDAIELEVAALLGGD